MNTPVSTSQHGCAIVLGNQGILVLGASGSGKSRLCHLLIEHWNAQNRFARWVADDRVILETVAGSEQEVGRTKKLISRSPEPIAGLAERRFFGIEHVAWQQRAVIDHVVELIDAKELDRLPDDGRIWPDMQKLRLPLMSVPANATEHAIELVEAHLRAK